jgi:hypothetical protein
MKYSPDRAASAETQLSAFIGRHYVKEAVRAAADD